MDITTNINLPFHSIHTDSKEQAWGTLIYITSYIAYTPQKDLNISKSHELQLIFIETINPQRSSKIIGLVHRYQTMDLNKFHDKYVNKLLENIAKGNNTIFYDFNIDLLKYDSNTPANESMNPLSSSIIIPDILHPAWVTGHSKTLIDNIFSSHISKEAIRRNLTPTISGHLPQFLKLPTTSSNHSLSISDVCERS